MGLVTALLTAPLAPVRGTVWLAQKLAEEADRQRGDDSWVREQLAALAAAHDAGEIDDDEYDQIEEELLRQMRQTSPRLTREGGA
jgi:cytochrome c-type biogenesis protein CcmI